MEEFQECSGKTSKKGLTEYTKKASMLNTGGSELG